MLGVIIGYCQITKEHLEAQHSAQNYVGEIRTAAERAVALTRQLLAFSRQQVLEPRNLNLNSVVHHISKMLRHMIGEDISLVLRPAEPIHSVRADLGQIEQILMNLAINARDAMPRGGRIVIETANVDLDEIYARDHHPIKPGPYVMLSFTDTGIGMDEATMAQAFEPFFTTKESGKGTGLGLSTVYGIVKQSDGHIWTYSEPGRGTTFKIYLPAVHQPAEILTPVKSDADSPRGTETVLVVEDEPALRKLTMRVLKSRGYEVLSAENASSTLELVRQYGHTIDLLLTDVVMPDMTGPDLVSRIRELRPELKVLYMSGYSRNVMVEQGVLAVDSNLIVKPFSSAALLTKMRAVLDHDAKQLECAAIF
jgi:CheY-like chemotaxis protein